MSTNLDTTTVAAIDLAAVKRSLGASENLPKACVEDIHNLIAAVEALRERVNWLEGRHDAEQEVGIKERIEHEALRGRAEAAEAREVELAGALIAFMKAKASVGGDSYDGVDEHTRYLLDHADAQAAIALASTPADALERARVIQKVADQLWIILPLAKGYAAKNNVGNNMQFIADAEQALAKLDALTPEDVGTGVKS